MLSIRKGCLLAAVFLVACSARADLPNPGTHLFESDFQGTLSYTLTSETPLPLTEGWTAHAESVPSPSRNAFASLNDGLLTFRGGQSSYAMIEHALSGIPEDYQVQFRFRIDGVHDFARNDFQFYIDRRTDNEEFFAYGSQGVGITNHSMYTNLVSDTFVQPLAQGQWYRAEIIRRGTSAPQEMTFHSANYTSPQKSVDWITIDEAPTGTRSLEMRIWADGESRPGTAQIYGNVIAPPEPPERCEPEPAPSGKNLVVVTNGWAGGSPNDAHTQAWMNNMVAAIQGKVDTLPDGDEWTVIAFDWTEASGRVGHSNTGPAWLNGHNKAFNLAQMHGLEQGSVWGDAQYDHVHVIGYSAASGFLDSAARAIKARSDETEVHLTFLDAFAHQRLADDGLGEAADWSEHYFTDGDAWWTEASLQSAHNVEISGLFEDPAHFSAVDFYRYSIDGVSYQSVFGDVYPGENEKKFAQIPDSGFPDAVVEGTELPYGFSLSKEGGYWFFDLDEGLQETLATGNAPVVLGRSGSAVADNTAVIFTQTTLIANLNSESGTVAVEDHAVNLATGSPVWTVMTFVLGDNANFLSFDLEFTSADGSEGLLTVYLDGELIGTIDERFTLDEESNFSWLLGGTEPGLHDLSFRLDPFTDITAVASIRNIEFGSIVTVPEPSLITMALIAFLPFVLVSRYCTRSVKSSR